MMDRRQFCKRAFGMGACVILSSVTFEKIWPHITSTERVYGSFDVGLKNSTLTFTLDEIDPELLMLALNGEKGSEAGKKAREKVGKLNFV